MENNKKKSKTAQKVESHNSSAGHIRYSDIFCERTTCHGIPVPADDPEPLVIGRAGSGKVFRCTKPYTTADPSDGSHCLRSTCRGVSTNL